MLADALAAGSGSRSVGTATPRRTVPDWLTPPHYAVNRALLAGVVGEGGRFERVTNHRPVAPCSERFVVSGMGRRPEQGATRMGSKKRTAQSDVLVSETGAADVLGVSKWTVRRLRQAGETSYVVVRHSIRIPMSEVEAYKARRTVAAR